MVRPVYYRPCRGCYRPQYYDAPWRGTYWYGPSWFDGPCIGRRCGGWYDVSDEPYMMPESIPVMENITPRPPAPRTLPDANPEWENPNMQGNMPNMGNNPNMPGNMNTWGYMDYED